MVGILRFVAVAGLPLVLAVLTVGLYGFWVLGIPGDPMADYAAGWYVGFFVMPIFLFLYSFGLLAHAVNWLLKGKLAGAIDGYIWASCLLFAISMGISVAMMPW